MNCSFCGIETEELVEGPAESAICYVCLRIGQAEHCAFCNQLIGTRKGFLKKRTLQVARMSNEVILCSDCLQTATEIASTAHETTAT